MNNDTYVIVPAYNEAPILGSVIKKLQKHFSNIVCVDDGSSDSTSQVISKSDAILINHPINLGAGAATQTGIEYALSQPKARYFITIDADDQHDTKDALRMLDCLKRDNFDIVLGSRFLGQTENMPILKRKFLKAAILFTNQTTGVKLTDSHVGLRVFNRNFANNLNITMNDWAHATELINRIKQHNYKYKEIPITITYSDYSKAKGQSMLNSVNIVVDLFMKRITKW